MATTRINPLSRRPKGRRLVVAVRGAAGTGKSVFASTLAEAGQGRLCFFDTERKARLLPGSDGSRFDALEIEHPDELPAFIEWALNGEGKSRGYGCFALDSWAMYFARKHRETLEAVRNRTGDPLARPSAEVLANDQMIFQEVLRRLCIDSGACVVITDQIAARGKEMQEENERGRVLPLTTGGLEYFVYVMLEMSLRLEGFEQVRVAQVVKSNSPAFPVGLELKNPTFAELLERVGGSAEMEPPPDAKAEPALLAEPEPEPEPGPTLEMLVSQAETYGVSRAELSVAARHYCSVPELERLNPDQIGGLMQRMTARYAARGDGATAAAAVAPAGKKKGTTPTV